MKQTAIQISMINNIQNSNNNGEQLMTSLEIAQLSGKQHFHVMEAIRKMETAWEAVAASKFRLGTYTDGNRQQRPCYLLTKTECLFIATKFNDEARARLVLRWEELEREKVVSAQRPKEIRLLACDELAKLNRNSRFCYTPTEIGKPFGLDGRDLNSFLADRNIIRWARGQWRLTQKYLHRELTEDRYHYIHGQDGRRKLVSSLVWTEKGRQFILDLIK